MARNLQQGNMETEYTGPWQFGW